MKDSNENQTAEQLVRDQFAEYIDRKGKGSMAAAARGMGLSASALSRWANGKYTGDNEKVTAAVASFLEREAARIQIEPLDEIPFQETSIYKRFFQAAKKAHITRSIALIIGPSGVGKTRIAKEYVNRNHGVMMIECDATQQLRHVMADIHRAAGMSGNGTAPDMLGELITRLRGSGRLLICDEAENLSSQSLDSIRRLHDKAGIGILYVGLKKFENKLLRLREEHEYLINRVRTKTELDYLDQNDTYAIASGILTEGLEDISDALHEASNGVARILIDLCKDARDLSQYKRKPVTETMLKHIVAERLL